MRIGYKSGRVFLIHMPVVVIVNSTNKNQTNTKLSFYNPFQLVVVSQSLVTGEAVGPSISTTTSYNTLFKKKSSTFCSIVICKQTADWNVIQQLTQSSIYSYTIIIPAKIRSIKTRIYFNVTPLLWSRAIIIPTNLL